MSHMRASLGTRPSHGKWVFCARGPFGFVGFRVLEVLLPTNESDLASFLRSAVQFANEGLYHLNLSNSGLTHLPESLGDLPSFLFPEGSRKLDETEDAHTGPQPARNTSVGLCQRLCLEDLNSRQAGCNWGKDVAMLCSALEHTVLRANLGACVETDSVGENGYVKLREASLTDWVIDDAGKGKREAAVCFRFAQESKANRRQLDIMDSLEALAVRIVAERAEIEEALKNEVTELKEELKTIQRGEGGFGKQKTSMQRSQADMRSALEAAL
ncbi:hypothetical protein BSKO_02842 [Bryopsis sp. KO-2023]|nr:hypothetical protein BSKO_02842 [Bryopsis sp. KO-2023]